MDERARRAPGIAMFFFGLNCIPIILSEWGVLDPALRVEYVVGKLILMVLILAVAFRLWRKYDSPGANLATGILGIVYTAHGQWYRPLYYLAFFQTSIAYSYFFVVPRRVYQVIMPLWVAAFLAVFTYRWPQYVEAMKTPLYSDVAISTVIVGVINTIVYRFITHDRVFRQNALARFSRIGFQSARLIHDLKGLTAAPRVYAQLLTRKLKGNADPEVIESLDNLTHDLENLSDVVIELNQMSSLRGEFTLSEFELRDAAEGARKLIRNRMRGVDVRIEGDLRIRSDRSIWTSVLLNLFLNSIEIFRQRQVESPQIRVTLGEGRVVFRDNGGGFEAGVLEALRDGRVESTKDQGSGIGLWMVIDGLGSLGSRARFRNEGSNACIEITVLS